jgi:hypothetical protein
MSGVSLETRWAIKKNWNSKFYYTVASCWLFLYDLYYDAQIHVHQVQKFVRSFVCSFVCLFVCLFILLFVLSFFLSFVRSFVRSSLRSVSFRFVPFRSVPFRSVPFRFVSFFISFFRSFSHTCNIWHVNYRLQFIYNNTTYNIWTSTQYNTINNICISK